MDCNICCVKTTSKRNPILNCSHCDIQACTNCHKRYICESTHDPQCMNCKTAFTQVFLYENFTKQYMNTTYKESRKNVLFDREKALLPHSQNDVDNVLNHREKEKKLSELKRKETELKTQLEQLRIEIYNTRRQETKMKNEKKYTHKCVSENCRGFLDDNYYCSLCECTICKKCNEVKGEDHECLQENIETMNLLKKDSKPCPGCGILITKIVGCSQMWCTNCHTTFNFNTGIKVNGVIHNPHYYEFLRNNRNIERNPQDIPCGGLPYAYVFLHKLNSVNLDTNTKNTLIKIHRNISHIINWELPRVPTNINNHNINRNLRVKYLLNELGEEDFKNTIYKNERSKIVDKEFGEIITMLTHTSSELLEGYIRQIDNENICPTETLSMLENLRNYANTNFAKIGKLFNKKHPYITNEFKYYKYN